MTQDYPYTFASFLPPTGVHNHGTSDPVTQTYRFECRGGVGDTILIEDTDAVIRGHGISEVKVYGNAYIAVSPGKLILS